MIMIFEITNDDVITKLFCFTITKTFMAKCEYFQ